jgi:hypothetical protein
MYTRRPRITVSKPKLLACALAACLAVGATSVIAQSTGATLRGQATGGAEITATNADTGLVRRVTATSDGSYTLAGLPPGTYSVQVAGGTAQTFTMGTMNMDLDNFRALYDRRVIRFVQFRGRARQQATKLHLQ